MDVTLIEAIAKLWPLALIISVLLLSILFRELIRTVLEKRSLKIKRGDTEISLEGEVAPQESEPQQVKSPVAEDDEVGDLQPILPDEEAAEGEGKDVEDLSTEMLLAFTRGDVEAGTEIFNRLQEAEADEIEKLRHRALFLYLKHQQGDLSALKGLKDLARNDDVRSEAYAWIGTSYDLASDFERASQAYGIAAESAENPGAAASHRVSEAQARLNLGEDEESILILSRALAETEDESVLAILYRGMARLYGSLDDKELQAIAYDMALRSQPNDIDLRFKVAFAFAEAEHYQLAMMHYETLLKFDPNHKSSRNNLGVTYDVLGLKNHSTRAYRRASDMGVTLASSNLANKYIGQGLIDDAKQILDDAKARDDVHANVGGAISGLAQSEEQEDEKREEIIKSSREVQRFFLSLSAALFPRAEGTPDFSGKWASEAQTEFEVTQANDQLVMTWGIGDKKHRIVGDLTNFGIRGEKQKMKYSVVKKTEFGFEESGKAFGYLSDEEQVWNLMVVEKSDFQFMTLRRAG